MNGPNSDLQAPHGQPNYYAYAPASGYAPVRVGAPMHTQTVPSSHSNFNSQNTSRGGSTPTLNQLLQSPNTGHRNQGSGYVDYTQPKIAAPDMPAGNQAQYMQGWNNGPRQMTPYQEQVQNSYGSQGYNGTMSYSQASHYSQQSQLPNASVGSHQKLAGQTASHASGLTPLPSSQPSKTDDHTRPPSHHSESGVALTNGLDSISVRGEDSNDSSVLSAKQDGACNVEDSSKTVEAVASGLPRSTTGSSQRPPPSPAGSTGSRSTTPHSTTGNPVGSPMPSRPPSTHLEMPGRITSPMNQGYGNSQMMPPPMGPSHAPYAPANKMQPGHNAMGPHNSHQYQIPQGPYGRPSGMLPQANYGSNQPSGNNMYGNHHPMGYNRMPQPGYPPQYGQQNTHNALMYGYNNHNMNIQGVSMPMSTASASAGNEQTSVERGMQSSSASQSSQPGSQQYGASAVPAASSHVPTSAAATAMGSNSGRRGAQAAAQAAVVAASQQHHSKPPASAPQSTPPYMSYNQPTRPTYGFGDASSASSAVLPVTLASDSHSTVSASPVTTHDSSHLDKKPHDNNLTSTTSIPDTGCHAANLPQSSSSLNNVSQPINSQASDGISNVSASQNCGVNTTQSVFEPIMNSAVKSIPSQANESSTHKTPVTSKPESIGTDESSQDSFKVAQSVKPELTKQQKASNDVLQRQCDMGGGSSEPGRRPLLEQLFAFMQERGSPINSMPTVSKNFIDLYALYTVVNEKGGLVEVTKQKRWREIATAINVGASSSGGFTLKKNYCKFLFPFVCKRDLGGIDPAPILAQVEGPQKKEKARASMSASTAPQQPYESISGAGGGAVGGGGGGGGMMHDAHHMMPPNVSMMPNQGIPPPYAPKPPMMPYPGGQAMPYQNNPAMRNVGSVGYQNTQPYAAAGNSSAMRNATPAAVPSPGHSAPSMRGPAPAVQNSDSNNSTLSQSDSLSGSDTPGTPGKQYPPSAPSPVSSYLSQPPVAVSPGYQRPHSNNSFNHYSQKPQSALFNSGSGHVDEAGFTAQSGDADSSDYAGISAPPSNASGAPSTALPQSSYTAQKPAYTQSTRREAWSSGGPVSASRGVSNQSSTFTSNSPAPISSTSAQQPGTLRFGGSHSADYKPPPSQVANSKSAARPQFSTMSYAPKKDLQFPADSVESTQPVLKKRRKYTHRDIGRVDPWRILMALRSGQLVESTWALDVLSVLLYDDHTVVFLGLQHLPGLLDALLDHFRRYLIEIFGHEFCELEVNCQETARPCDCGGQGVQPHEATKQSPASAHPAAALPAAQRHVVSTDESREDDVIDSQSEHFAQSLREISTKLSFDVPDAHLLQAPDNYTLRSRCGKCVRFRPNVDDLHLALDDKSWDIYSHVSCSKKRVFDMGRSDRTLHVVTHLESDTSLQVLRQRFHKLGGATQPTAVKSSSQFKQLPTDAADSKCIEVKSDTVDCIKLETANQTTKADIVVSIKSEPVTEGDSSLVDVDTARTEFGSNCSTDSGIAIKSEASSPDVKAPETKTFEAKQELGCARDDPSATGSNDQLLLSRLKRRLEERDMDGEEYRQDEAAICLLRDSQHELATRCCCLANILRNLSFIPGNDREMAQHSALIALLGKLLLFGHEHRPRPRREERTTFERDTDADDDDDDVVDSERTNWWWPTLDAVREDILVLLANVSGHLHLANFPDALCLPLLDGLLHWVVCPSAYAHDPMPTMSRHSVLSPKKLVIETIAKLCVTELNVDLILATPPFSRLVDVLGVLVKCVADTNDVVLRELSIAIVSYLVQGECGAAARAVALQAPAITLLLDFLEAADARTEQLLKSHAGGPHLARSGGGDTAELIGTSIDMLRKAALTLRCLADVPENRPLLLPKQERILNLVMSNCMDSKVVEYLSDVLFSCSQDPSS